MELEEWEFLPNNNLCSSETSEEKSYHDHEEYQHQVSAEIALLPTEDIKEIIEECDSVPQVQLETTAIEPEEKGVELSKEKSEIEVSGNLEFAEVEEEQEVDDANNQISLKWRVRGLIGALSSVGIAAASFTMLTILGGSKGNQNRELQKQIYADEKKNKQGVQQSTKLSQAL